MKCRMFLTLLVLAAPLLAQEAKPSQSREGWVSKVFEVKYREPNRLFELVSGFGADVRPSAQLKAIAVTGPAAVVDAIGETIKRFDVPLKNVELTTYILLGQLREGETPTVPKELEGVVKQLRSLFSFQAFRVLDTAVLRAREGQGGRVSGAFSPPAGTSYNLELNSIAVTTDGKDNIVRVTGIRFSATRLGSIAPGNPQTQLQQAGISTDIDVREGQKVVVGKANVDDSGNALILVVTAKVVD
jgi:hypothetical protein